MALAEHLGLNSRDVRTFGVAGLLHDLWQVKVPMEILNKPGKLTDEERAVMQKSHDRGREVDHHQRPRSSTWPPPWRTSITSC